MKRIFKVTVILVIISKLPIAYAFSCHAKSPNYLALGEEYFEVDNSLDISGKDKRALSSFYDKVEGDWRGSSTEVVCKGSDKNPKKLHKNATISANFKEGSSKTLKIVLSKKYQKIKATINDKFELLSQDHIFNFEFSNSTISSSEKYLRRVSGKNARLVEMITMLSVEGKFLVLNITYYSNGYSTGNEVITLRPK